MSEPARPHRWVAAACLVYTAYALSRWFQVLPAGYDLGIFDQAVRHYALLQPPVVSLKGPGFNLLGDHFHPVLALLAPLYWLWDDPRMLLLAQVALVGLSAYPVHAVARRRLGERWAGWLTAGYLLGWPLQGLVDFDMHEIAFGVPIVAFACEALDRRAARPFVLWLLGLLLVREDMGIVVASLALTWGLRWRDWRMPAALAAAGLAALALITSVVLPALNPAGEFAYWHYGQYAPDARGLVGWALTHPLELARALFWPPVKTWTWVALFVPLLLLPALSPLTLAVLPVLASRMLSSRPGLWTTGYHYSAILWPILLVAALHGADRVARWLGPQGAAGRVHRWLAASVAGVALVGTLAHPADFPVFRLWTGVALEATERSGHQKDALAAVPAGVCVMADDRLAARLTRTNIVYTRFEQGAGVDLALIDHEQPTVNMWENTPGQMAAQARAHGLVPVARHGQIEIFERPGAAPSPECSVQRSSLLAALSGSGARR